MEPIDRLRRIPTLRFLQRLFPPAPPAIEIELCARLLGSSDAIGVVGVVACVVGFEAVLNNDPFSAVFMFSAALVALLRVLVLRRLRLCHGAQPPNLAVARRWERSYALGSFSSSFLLGAANFNSLSSSDPPLALLTICALCCYVFSLILRTAVRPLVCLPSVAAVLVSTLAGLPLFVSQSNRMEPMFATLAMATLAVIMVLSCVQLTGHLYRATLQQLLAQRDLLRFARQDALTGLDNRLALRERFEILAPGPARPAALLYLDLDKFKPVNDLHGHQVGDALLCEVAVRLAACLRPSDGAFRIGGDEFIVLMSRVRQRSETTRVAHQLLASLSEPYSLKGVTVRIGASIGIAFADTANAELDEVTAAADAALYDAKRSGRGTYRLAKEASPLRLIA